MKALTWVIAGVGVGIAAYIVLNQPGPQYATGDDDVEYAAGRASFLGVEAAHFGNRRRARRQVERGHRRVTGERSTGR